MPYSLLSNETTGSGALALLFTEGLDLFPEIWRELEIYVRSIAEKGRVRPRRVACYSPLLLLCFAV